MSDEEEIERLVDYLIAYGFDDEPKVLDEESARRLRQAALQVHAKWKANPALEDLEMKLDDIRAGEDTISYDESFDGDDLDEIFSGRDAAKRAEAARKEKERDEERTRERERVQADKDREKAKADTRALVVMAVVAIALAIGVAWVFLGDGREGKHDKKHDKNETHHTEQR